MTADAQGNDLSAVPVPVTGLAAIAPVDAANVLTKAELAARPIVMPGAFSKLGLIKVDGGFEAARDSGDAILFFQKGYQLSGEGTRTVKIGLAENNPTVLKLIEGAEPDVNGVIEVSSSLPNNQWILFTSTKYRNKTEERQIGVAYVSAVEPDKAERGSVKGAVVTLTYVEHELFNEAPFWQVVLPAPGATITPTGVTAGTPGSFSPVGATPPSTIAELRALGALGQTTAWTTGQYVVYATSSHAHWDGTDWQTGNAA
ncbi:hypothetical protein ACTJI8_12815 [Microbacterium sp. 22303]|uniref:hypothetical protein n=1 Tax=Microbacterium sp. 22303 TaxID=3453905 RepID=UPI003F830BA2